MVNNTQSNWVFAQWPKSENPVILKISTVNISLPKWGGKYEIRVSHGNEY